MDHRWRCIGEVVRINEITWDPTRQAAERWQHRGIRQRQPIDGRDFLPCKPLRGRLHLTSKLPWIDRLRGRQIARPVHQLCALIKTKNMKVNNSCGEIGHISCNCADYRRQISHRSHHHSINLKNESSILVVGLFQVLPIMTRMAFI